jgi:hypothetical protein
MLSPYFSRSQTPLSAEPWRRSIVVLCALVIAADAATWIALVPGVISVAAFGWANALVAMMMGVGVVAATGALPTRSIVHVLHDVEHPPARGR